MVSSSTLPEGVRTALGGELTLVSRCVLPHAPQHVVDAICSIALSQVGTEHGTDGMDKDRLHALFCSVTGQLVSPHRLAIHPSTTLPPSVPLDWEQFIAQLKHQGVL